MTTYAVAVFSGGSQWAVIKITSAPAYSVIAVCTSESDASAFVAALS